MYDIFNSRTTITKSLIINVWVRSSEITEFAEMWQLIRSNMPHIRLTGNAIPAIPVRQYKLHLRLTSDPRSPAAPLPSAFTPLCLSVARLGVLITLFIKSPHFLEIIRYLRCVRFGTTFRAHTICISNSGKSS